MITTMASFIEITIVPNVVKPQILFFSIQTRLLLETWFIGTVFACTFIVSTITGTPSSGLTWPSLKLKACKLKYKHSSYNSGTPYEMVLVIISYLYVIIMSRTSFRVNLHSILCLNVKELLAPSRDYICNLSDRFRPVWLNGWVFIHELSGYGFESRCCHHILPFNHMMSMWRLIIDGSLKG